MPDVTTSPRAVNFRMAVRNLLDKYLWRLRSYIISAIEGTEDMAIIESEIFKVISSITKVIDQYYGTAASLEFKRLLNDYSIRIIDEVRAIKSGRDTTNFDKTLSVDIDLLGDFLDKANPNNWPKEAVKKIFKDLAKSFIDQALARKSKKWMDDILASDNAQKIILVGNESMQPFSEIFAKGIINSFPENFK